MSELETQIDNKNLYDAIRFALNEFYNNDKILINDSSHEQTISHRLAFYLELFIKIDNKNNSYNIDCEYNKKGKYVKSFAHKDYEDFYEKDNCIIKSKDNTLNGKIVLNEGKIGLVLYEEGELSFIGKILNGEINVKTLKSSNVRPDIIIHKRNGNNEENLCVFEIKKKSLDEKDLLKLKGFTKKGLGFDYQYGIGLYNFKDNGVTIEVYKNGKKVLSTTFNP